MTQTRQIALILLVAIVLTGFTHAQERIRTDLPVIFNQDFSEFFVGSFGPVVPSTIDTFVDSLRNTSITDLFVCVNAQRTNYRSSVWEAEGDGYDPKLGDDQPFFSGISKDRLFEREWYRTSYEWMQSGVDYPGRMLAAARRNRLRGWISIRMNDAHYSDLPHHPYHSHFWQEHPEWRLANGSLDYAHPEVREHYLKLIAEVLERYEMHGLELDFMRHGHYFRPDAIHAGRATMDAFVREVRAMIARSVARSGYPIELAVRVPSDPWTASQRGLDAVAWGRDGYVDLVIPSPWWTSALVDIPVESWKGLLAGTGVRVAPALEDGLRAHPSDYRRTLSTEEARGALLSFASRSADALYLFNWFAGPLHEWHKDEYSSFFATAGSPQWMITKPRRHPVTLVDPWAAGMPGRPLPFVTDENPLLLRIHIGPAPLSSAKVQVRLRISAGTPPDSVSVNGSVCRRTGRANDFEVYAVSSESLRSGYNLVEISTANGTRANWAELFIVPATESK